MVQNMVLYGGGEVFFNMNYELRLLMEECHTL